MYSLGLLLYELLLGTHPFAAETDELRLTLQLYSQPQSPRTHWPEIPPATEAWLLKLLALAPEAARRSEGFQRSMRGFVEIAEGIKAGENVVVAANFLIDAESNLKAALSSFTAEPSPAPTAAEKQP